MNIRKFGLELSSLQEEDLAQVLEWRNDPEINQYMLYQHHISMEDHLAWFASLGMYSHYLMVRYDGKKIGVFNLRDIDWEQASAEAGIFIGDSHYRHSFVPMLCILAMMDVCFDMLGFKELTARVRKDNSVALRMNQDLGYTLADMYDDAYHLRVEAADYKKKRERFDHFLKRYDQDGEELSFSPEEMAFFRPVK